MELWNQFGSLEALSEVELGNSSLCGDTFLSFFNFTSSAANSVLSGVDGSFEIPKNKQQYNGEIRPIHNHCSESNILVNSTHEKLISTSYHSSKAININGPFKLQEVYPNQCQQYFTATRKFSSTAKVYAAGK